jgi:hypothetical protein
MRCTEGPQGLRTEGRKATLWLHDKRITLGKKLWKIPHGQGIKVLSLPPPSCLFVFFFAFTYLSVALSFVSFFVCFPLPSFVSSPACLCPFFPPADVLFIAAYQRLSLLPPITQYLWHSETVNNHKLLLTQGRSYGVGVGGECCRLHGRQFKGQQRSVQFSFVKVLAAHQRTGQLQNDHKTIRTRVRQTDTHKLHNKTVNRNWIYGFNLNTN